MSQNWGRAERVFEGGEGFFRLRGPFELDFFAREVCEDCGNLAVVLDEASVEIGEPEEYLDVVGGLWAFPTQDYLHLIGIHVYAFRGDHETEEGDLRFVELTLLGLDILLESCFLESLKD